MATESRPSCCWGCLTEQFIPSIPGQQVREGSAAQLARPAAGREGGALCTWQLSTRAACHTKGCAKLWKNPKPNGVLPKPHGIARELGLPEHAAPAQAPQQGDPCSPLTGHFKETSWLVPVQQTSGAHHTRGELPGIHLFKHETLGHTAISAPKSKHHLVQCDGLAPQAGHRGESQGFGLDSRKP